MSFVILKGRKGDFNTISQGMKRSFFVKENPYALLFMVLAIMSAFMLRAAASNMSLYSPP